MKYEITPEMVYGKSVPELLAEPYLVGYLARGNYDVAEFRPPKDGEKFIVCDPPRTVTPAAHDWEVPRLIVTKKKVRKYLFTPADPQPTHITRGDFYMLGNDVQSIFAHSQATAPRWGYIVMHREVIEQ